MIDDMDLHPSNALTESLQVQLGDLSVSLVICIHDGPKSGEHLIVEGVVIDLKAIINQMEQGMYHLFGMVLQDTWLFKGTIMENIRYGRLDATDEEVIAAAKAARAHHFIQTLPGGYQMELNEDASNVSQGQK